MDHGSSSDSSLGNNTRSDGWTGVLFVVSRMHCRSVNRGMGDVSDVDSRGMFSQCAPEQDSTSGSIDTAITP